MKKSLIALFTLTALTALAIDVPQGTTVEKEVVTTTTESVSVVAIHHPRIMIFSNKDTGKLFLLVTRDSYLADKTKTTERLRFSQTEVITLLGGVEQFGQVFGAIEAALQRKANADYTTIP